jgi:hypothetical protein
METQNNKITILVPHKGKTWLLNQLNRDIQEYPTHISGILLRIRNELPEIPNNGLLIHADSDTLGFHVPTNREDSSLYLMDNRFHLLYMIQ